MSDEVREHPDQYSIIYVPNGFVIPGKWANLAGKCVTQRSNKGTRILRSVSERHLALAEWQNMLLVPFDFFPVENRSNNHYIHKPYSKLVRRKRAEANIL
jgi:hypothetical protein